MSEMIRNKPQGDDWANKGENAATKKQPGLDDGGRGTTVAPKRDEFIPVKKVGNLMDLNSDDELKPNKGGKGFVH